MDSYEEAGLFDELDELDDAPCRGKVVMSRCIQNTNSSGKQRLKHFSGRS
jgi:hypothetical protein